MIVKPVTAVDFMTVVIPVTLLSSYSKEFAETAHTDTTEMK